MQSVDKETFSYWVTHPDDLTTADLQLLQESLAQYPYCQALYTLTAKAASLHRKSQTVSYTRLAAAHALSRSALRKLMDNEFQWSDNLLSKLNELSARQVPIPEDYQQESYALFKSKSGLNGGLVDLPLIRIPEPTMPEIVVPEPDDSTLSETTLQQDLIGHPEADAVAPSPMETARQKQIEIIESFIKKEPGLAPLRSKLGDPEPTNQEDLAERNAPIRVGRGGLATESFAKILLKQGKTGKAIEIYEQLSLKNPQKKAYFAAKISEIKAGQS
ncbi:hypothetical protein F5984_13605 [Rudanella paleaurantiibacter]|uniref:Tetratricopeptide repeat protein n=1 Tax=Rudanella paleaurantiibacter TaxID=2614655 RepID=A0A7J5TYR5_9BACT|nr:MULTISPECIES: hypothetical protein [Rudanella]KAB7730205.1 hypothetical protein F5984_13605 [Rudanella paleaurantiibacter]